MQDLIQSVWIELRGSLHRGKRFVHPSLASVDRAEPEQESGVVWSSYCSDFKRRDGAIVIQETPVVIVSLGPMGFR